MIKPTMKEIARRAKVSQPTVSRVINGHKGVRPEIVDTVTRVIEEMGYVPNKAAQALKRSSTNIIGISVKEINNPYFVEIIDTLELEARKNGYNILFHNANFNPVTEWENIQNFVARQVDGIVIVPTSDFNMERIAKLNIPAVVITQSREQLDSVALNHLQAGRLAAERFIHAGHKCFGYAGAEPSGEKFSGYDLSLQENGFSFDPKHFVPVQPGSNSHIMVRRDIEAYMDATPHLAYSCIFADNDIVAMEFMRAAQERGLRVPEDICIIGCDDTYLSKIMEISSIHQPISEMVKTTFEVLMSRVHQNNSSSLVNILVEPTLIERKSSKFRKNE